MGFNYTDAVFQIKATEFDVEKEDSTEVVEYTSTDHAVLNALANRAANETGICWPGFGRIAKDAHVSRSSVIRSIATLGELGFIKIDPPNDERTSNTYTLNLEKLEAASVKPPKPKTKMFRNKRLRDMNITRRAKPLVRKLTAEEDKIIGDHYIDCPCELCRIHDAQCKAASPMSSYSQVSKEELAFLDESKNTVVFNIEADDDEFA